MLSPWCCRPLWAARLPQSPRNFDDRSAVCGLAACLSVLCWIGLTAIAPAADEVKPDDLTVKIAEEQSGIWRPRPAWKRVKPQSGIVEHEFAVAPTEGDEQGGRVTVMGAGGSVDANIDRWFGQFTKSPMAPTPRPSSRTNSRSWSWPVSKCIWSISPAPTKTSVGPSIQPPRSNAKNIRMLGRRGHFAQAGQLLHQVLRTRADRGSKRQGL